MPIYSIFIVNKAGGLIYNYDHAWPQTEVEKTFSYPLDLKLKQQNDAVVVDFGQRDGIRVGHNVLAINGKSVETGAVFEDTLASGDQISVNVLDFLKEEKNYPVSIKFGRNKLRTNEKIMLASMFHSLFAIGCQLSPEPKSSGIQVIDTDAFRLHCYQTITGLKFITLTDTKMANTDIFLKKVYEIYTDFALKNPFYSLEMPVRCQLFDVSLTGLLETVDKTGLVNL